MAHHTNPPRFAPVFLRFALGITFLIAGIAKFNYTIPVSDPADIALLNQWGVLSTSATPPSPQPSPPTLPNDSDTSPPQDDTPAAPDSTPETEQPQAPPPSSPDPAEPEPSDDEPAPTEPTEQVPPPDQPLLPAAPDNDSPESSQTPSPVLPTTQSALPYTLTLAQSMPAPDVSSTPSVPMRYGIALAIHHAAHPQADDTGATPSPIWPPALAGGNWPPRLALAVAVTELAAGILLLLGLFTRLSALAVMGVMLGAMWLTQFGPAIQTGNTFLFILPAPPPGRAWDPTHWQSLLWQLTLFCSAASLLLLGCGTVALHHLMPWARTTRHAHTDQDNDDL